MLTKRLLKTQYVESASPNERIKAAEAEIQAILTYHGCSLGVSIIRMKDKVVHQEIVVIDAKE